MKAKLAIADSWYKEGGTAALTQAEQEYKDFITFFPNAPRGRRGPECVSATSTSARWTSLTATTSKVTHAEEEYRLMLQQFPESTLVPQAKQRLREVQEVMATRESAIAAFYATHSKLARGPSPATQNRPLDNYPQYSHMDEVLISLGDAYETEAKYVRTLKLPEEGKARLEKIYDDQAIAAYSKVILDHSASQHVEDARDRLEAMNVPIPPRPHPEQIAASLALENSRRQYRLQDRAMVLFMHRPDGRSHRTRRANPLWPIQPQPSPRTSPTRFRATSRAPSHQEAPQPPPLLQPKAGTDGTAQPNAAPAEAAAEPAASTPAAPLQLQDVPRCRCRNS